MRNPTLVEWGEVQGLERAATLARRSFEVAAAALALRIAEIQSACEAHGSFQMTREMGTETITWATKEGHAVGLDGKLIVKPAAPVVAPAPAKRPPNGRRPETGR